MRQRYLAWNPAIQPQFATETALRAALTPLLAPPRMILAVLERGGWRWEGHRGRVLQAALPYLWQSSEAQKCAKSFGRPSSFFVIQHSLRQIPVVTKPILPAFEISPKLGTELVAAAHRLS